MPTSRASSALQSIPDLQQWRGQQRPLAQAERQAPAARQPASLIAFHWVTVVSLVLAVAAIYLREVAVDKASRTLLLELHRQLGLLVLVTVPLRLAFRKFTGHRDFSADLAAIYQRAAVACHVVLYLALLAIPLLGWALTNAHAIDLRFFGLFKLPAIIAADSDLADTLTDWHTWAAYGLGAVVLMHVVAALWHHVALKDEVLTAMVPGLKRSGAGD